MLCGKEIHTEEELKDTDTRMSTRLTIVNVIVVVVMIVIVGMRVRQITSPTQPNATQLDRYVTTKYQDKRDPQ